MKRARKNNDHPANKGTPSSLLKKEFKPPSGSWEHDVDVVDMFHDREAGGLMVYVTWKNGKKTQHTAKQCYTRCPQKVCAPAHGVAVQMATNKCEDAPVLRVKDKLQMGRIGFETAD